MVVDVELLIAAANVRSFAPSFDHWSGARAADTHEACAIAEHRGLMTRSRGAPATSRASSSRRRNGRRWEAMISR
jgi:hypothetical protein